MDRNSIFTIDRCLAVQLTIISFHLLLMCLFVANILCGKHAIEEIHHGCVDFEEVCVAHEVVRVVRYH